MFFTQKEKRHLEESLAEIKEQEEEMSRANRALTVRLEDVQVRRVGPGWDADPHVDLLIVALPLQRNLTRLNVMHKELEEMLQEERSQKEQFKNMKNNIEDERRLLDRTVEKLQREVSAFKCAAQKDLPPQILNKPSSFLWKRAEFNLLRPRTRSH